MVDILRVVKERSCSSCYDDDVMVIDDDYGVLTYIWYDVNGFVLLLGDITYA